jgi:hypothetical protein
MNGDRVLLLASRGLGHSSPGSDARVMLDEHVRVDHAHRRKRIGLW